MNQQSSVPFIVVGIDGTGSRTWRRPDGKNSSVYKFVHDFNFGSIGTHRMYYHGPSNVMNGSDSESILHNALQFINSRLRQLSPQVRQRNVQPLSMYDVNSCHQANERARADMAREKEGTYFGSPTVRVPVQVNARMLAGQVLSTNQVRVVIVGHSRGGLIATLLARMLSPIVKVYFLGLYDAVDWQPCLDGMVVENVKYVYHARRNPEVGSRSYFGNTSIVYRSDEPKQEKFFNTSHGGVGGSFTVGEYATGFGADNSCTPRPDTRIVFTKTDRLLRVDNRHPLTRKLGKPIEQICAEGALSADAFIREGARKYGLPVQ